MKPRVLFVCVGNAIRSQFAEAFARTYGAEVMDPLSAGVAPAMNIMPLTRKVLLDRGIDIGDVVPKGLWEFAGAPLDLVVNISGQRLPIQTECPVVDWKVKDPLGGEEKLYVKTADEIETLIKSLVAEMRNV